MLFNFPACSSSMSLALISATVPSPRVNRCVASRFFSVNLKVLSQSNLRGSLCKAHDLLRLAGLRTQHLVLWFCLYLLVAVHTLITAVRIFQHIIGCIHGTFTHCCHFSLFLIKYLSKIVPN
jgi:hypothetical protein